MLNENDLKQNDIFKLLDSLDLSSDEYLIMGSGIMFALGIRPLEDLDDLDLFVPNSTFERVKTLGEILYYEPWDSYHIFLFDRKVEIWNGWGPKDYSFTNLYKNALHVGKYTFECIEDVLEWKTTMGREKDMKHIEMIKNYLKQSPH